MKNFKTETLQLIKEIGYTKKDIDFITKNRMVFDGCLGDENQDNYLKLEFNSIDGFFKQAQKVNYDNMSYYNNDSLNGLKIVFKDGTWLKRVWKNSWVGVEWLHLKTPEKGRKSVGW